jgi:peptidoglycan/LPS O-acetylase OafA/YrhL
MRDQTRQIPFIALLRGVAALLVVYCHTVGWADVLHVSFEPHTLVKQYIISPLLIVQNFGFFGVALFFLISGFIITHTIQRETRTAFLVKRLFRIYPPFWVAVLVTVVAFDVWNRLTGTSNNIVAISRSNILWHLTLTDVLTPGHVAVLGVAWTLTIEMTFYLACWAILPLIRTRPALAIATLLIASVIFVRIATIPHYVPTLGYPRIIVGYLPMLVMGMVAWGTWSRRISPHVALALGIAAWCCIVYCKRATLSNTLEPANSYLISYIEAGALFAAFLLLNDRIRLGRVGAFFGNISYSLYLYHATFGTYAVAHLYNRIGFPAALGVALALSFTLAYLSWRFVERRCQQWARTLLTWRPRRQAETPEMVSPAFMD